MPPPDIFSRLDRIGDRLLPAPEPNLNSIASVLARSMIELIESWTELMKQAEHCGLASIPTLNQTGELNAHLLVDEQVGQLGLERAEVLVGREVVLGLGPGRDRVDDPVDELADARLALGRARGGRGSTC